ncbi:polymorphic toxin type 44 domain-containing protein [Achromobacter sp. ESBL13]|uniref:polymorphic toxin type 44 domain-containing protein n=1 Tax=Achromobacter sp. ESBL13 TaxID=3077328 RepID=UPI002FC6A02E
MSARPIIRIGDTTSHGGTVLQGISFYLIEGKAASGLGHMVSCPQCKGTYPIAEGVSTFMVDGIRLAIDGMQTSCGATLIASQNIAVLAQDLGFRAHAGNAKSASPDRDSSSERIRAKAPDHVVCDHADTAVAVAEYIVREMKTNPFSVEGRKILGANSADPDAQTAEWHRLRWHEKLAGRPDYHAAAAAQKAAAYAMWVERVGPGRPWDHKPLLRRRLGPHGFNRGWQKLGDFDYYYDIWSNIHYGYVGVALGFSEAELLHGAGLAQALSDAYRSMKDGKLPRWQDHSTNGTWPASADDVPDHISIKLGCDLYAASKPHELTSATLLERISAVPLPWGIAEHRAKELHECSR